MPLPITRITINFSSDIFTDNTFHTPAFQFYTIPLRLVCIYT